MISIITCSRDDRKFQSLASMYARIFRGIEFEMVRIPDATGLCEGYNRGMKRSRGDLLVFCHDDMEVLNDDAGGGLVNHLKTWDIIGIAGTNRLRDGGWISSGHPHIFGKICAPYPGGFNVSLYGRSHEITGGIQAMDGVFLACRREVAEQLGWDAETFDDWHLYDLDFTFRAHQAGLKLAVVNDVFVCHYSTGRFDSRHKFYADRFEEKYRGKLEPCTIRPFQYSAVLVKSKEEAVELMRNC